MRAMNLTMTGGTLERVLGSLGVPLAKPRVALSAASPRSFLAVGFPLQSLTLKLSDAA
jgi:hypothetical protein